MEDYFVPGNKAKNNKKIFYNPQSRCIIYYFKNIIIYVLYLPYYYYLLLHMRK